MATQVIPQDPFELRAVTDAGHYLAELCSIHAADFASRAAQHDRDATFPHENIAALQESGVMAASVPHELGGMGVTAIQDLAVGINRLARGDGATALAVNMHLNVPWLIAPQWQAAVAAGDTEAAAPLESLLRAIGAGQIVIAAAFSEPGTDMFHPLLTGTRVDGGWSLTGRKIFATAAPAAHLVFVPFRAAGAAGEERTLATMVAAGTAGMEVGDTWDALGMRASASQDLVFSGCVIPDAGVIEVGPWGEWSATWLVGVVSNHLGLAAAFLGIAEAARDHALELVTSQRKAPSGRLPAERAGVQHLIAENEIGLAAARAMLGRSARHADAFFAARTDAGDSLDALHGLHKDFQCTKWFVTRTAIEVVDRALTLSGGSGYLNSSPLARLYRDVRAGPLMQPFSPNEAFEYIGKVTAGLDPAPAA